MPSYRRLPSGKWQATVRLPSGKRIIETDKLKDVVKAWAVKQEAAINAGHRVNPRAGRMLLTEWHKTWMAARVVEDETRRNDEGAWRNHRTALEGMADRRHRTHRRPVLGQHDAT